MTEPTVDNRYTLNEALELLTIGEIRAIERHYGKVFGENMNAYSELTPGAIYSLERRKTFGVEGVPNVTWDGIEAMTTKEVNAYFTVEEMEIDPTEPRG